MALIRCSECHHKISDQAEKCTYCGCPVSITLTKKQDDFSKKEQHSKDRKSKIKSIENSFISWHKNNKKLRYIVYTTFLVLAVIVILSVIPKHCHSCKGDGYIFCSNCSDGHIVCVECNEGNVKCPTCGGKTCVKCSSCNGSGYNICSKCKGAGEKESIGKCTMCGGNGSVSLKCENCNGWGKVSQYGLGNYATCAKCGGTGKTSIQCPICRGDGKMTLHEKCDSCKGSGLSSVKCSVCKGAKEISCNTCDEQGIVPCSKCNGTLLANCPICKGSSIIQCPDCNGNGKEYPDNYIAKLWYKS